MSPAPDLPCRVFVELVTDYLDGALGPAERGMVDAHLAICPHCVEVLEQWRTVIRLAGRLGEEHVDGLGPDVRVSLMGAFVAARRPPSPPA